MNRILVWHFGSSEQPAYYMERDYTPTAVRLYARIVASGGDLEVDIRDDGASIFANQSSEVTTPSYSDSNIQYSSQTAAFTVGGTVSGGTSGASGVVVSDTLGSLMVSGVGAADFSVGETITVGTTTATVDSFVRGRHAKAYSMSPDKRVATLSAGDNLNEMAEDFPANKPPIETGSVVTAHLIDTHGAGDITIQLELESLDEEFEEAD